MEGNETNTSIATLHYIYTRKRHHMHTSVTTVYISGVFMSASTPHVPSPDVPRARRM